MPVAHGRVARYWTIRDSGFEGIGESRVIAKHPSDTASPGPALQPLASITDDLTISGPGAANLTISGKNAVHVLFVNAGVTLTVQDLTVASGDADIRSGKLTPAQGQPFTDEANAIIAALGG